MTHSASPRPALASPPLPRLIQLCRWFLPSVGGAQVHAARLAEAYLDLGGETQIVAARFDANWPAEERMSGGRLRVRRLFSPQSPRGIGTLLWLAGVRRVLLRERIHYDGILVNFLKYEAMLAGQLRARLRAPVVARAEGADIATLNALPTKRFVAAGLRKCDRLVAVSQRGRRILLEAGFADRQVVWIPNGVDCVRFRPATDESERAALRAELLQRMANVAPAGPPGEEAGPGAAEPPAVPDAAVRILLWVGRVVPVKGLDVLVRAVKLLDARERARLRIVIVGDGPERALLERETGAADLSPTFRWLGGVADPAPLLRGADGFVLPSRTEGLSLALLEGMASGLVPISSRVSGSEDHIRPGETGMLAVPEDAVSLQGALADFLALPEERLAAMGVAARAQVAANCAFPVVARRYADLFTELRGELAAQRRARSAASR